MTTQYPQFSGHTSPVFCIKVLDNVVVSGSGDCSLRIWSLTTSQCLRELPGSPGQNDVMLATGHMDWVNAVDCAEGYIFSGSVDRTIRR
jgi:WD40 repeat protein